MKVASTGHDTLRRRFLRLHFCEVAADKEAARAKRFEAVSPHDLAMVARAEASSAEAMDLLYRALAISRETGLSHVGP